jgi:hypothetical protein
MPERDSPAVPARAGLWWQVPVAIGLWLVFFEWPQPPGAGLDSSWQHALTDAWIHRRAFGSDFDFTYGPWGFLLPPESMPAGFQLHLAFQIGAKLLLAIALVEFSARLRPVLRVAFLAVVAMLGSAYDDPTQMAFIGIVAFAWLLPEKSTRARILLGGLVLGWLSLMKFSLLVLASLSVATVAAIVALQSRRTRAIGIIVSYACALLLLWLVAGQRLADSTAFLWLSGQLSLGYASAMYIDEGRRIFTIGVLLLAVHAVWLLWFVFTDRPRGIALLTTAYLALSLLFAWKQGFTRADTHVLCFFMYSVFLVTALPGLVPRAFSLQHATVVIVLSTIGIVSVSKAFHMGSWWNPWYRMQFAAKQLDSFDEARRRFEQAAAASKAGQLLPAVRAEVANSSIDFLGDRQALILFNDLNYRPRPVFQSYAVYTRALLEKNFEFIQSDRRPDYLLAELQPIDGRIGGSYDSWLMAELPRRYEPVLSEQGLLLLRQRRPQPPAHPLTLTPLYDRDVAFGERVDLPADRTHALWLEVDAHPTIAGQLRSVFYKPPPLTITTYDDFGDRPYRLVAPVAAAGFIVQPPLSSTRDLTAFVAGRATSWTSAFTIGAPPAAKRYWRTAHVKLSRLDEIALSPVQTRSVFEEAGITDIRPESLRSDVDWRVSEQPETLLLEAPGEIRFQPPRGRRRFTGHFGIFDGAYVDGRTDGVEFSISIVRNGLGAEQRVWSVLLEPLTHMDDRGTHRFVIDLPDDVAHVIVRTGPGPAGNNAWDWSYLGRLRFESGQQ